jgi:hypothetical protein
MMKSKKMPAWMKYVYVVALVYEEPLKEFLMSVQVDGMNYRKLFKWKKYYWQDKSYK